MTKPEMTCRDKIISQKEILSKRKLFEVIINALREKKNLSPNFEKESFCQKPFFYKIWQSRSQIQGKQNSSSERRGRKGMGFTE